MKKRVLSIALALSVMLCMACGEQKTSVDNGGKEQEALVSVSEEPVTSVSVSIEPEPEPEPEPEEIQIGGFVISGDRLSARGGRYEQDGEEGNGPEEIKWTVIYDDESTMILLSENVLDCMPFNSSYKGTNWDKSYIRTFLNEDFYETVFSDECKSVILDYATTKGFDPSTVESPESEGEEGEEVSEAEPMEAIEEVTDKVFLLSLEELKEMLSDNIEGDSESRMAKATAYALSKGVFAINEETYELFGYKEKGMSEKVIGSANWWLRDSGGKDTEAMDVGPTGFIRLTGHDVGSKLDGIRPAIMINVAQ